MSKRYHDWYRVQQRAQGWNSVPADLAVAEKLRPMALKINFDYCHYGLKSLLQEFECPAAQQPDFYIVTELELGKKPLEQLFDFYRGLYENSRVGMYPKTPKPRTRSGSIYLNAISSKRCYQPFCVLLLPPSAEF